MLIYVPLQEYIFIYVPLVVLCRYNRLDYLYLNAGIMPNPHFDVKAFFKGIFSRYTVDFRCSWLLHIMFFLYSDMFSTHIHLDIAYFSSLFPMTSLQQYHHHVCHRWGDTDSEGRCHLWWAARSFCNESVWSLPSSEWLVFLHLNDLVFSPDPHKEYSARGIFSSVFLSVVCPWQRNVGDTVSVCSLATMPIKN